MKIREGLKMQGSITLQAIDIKTNKVVYEKEYKNLLTAPNRDYRLGMLNQAYLVEGYEIQDLAIKYFALGNTTGAVSESDTELVNETDRKALTQIATSGDTVTTVVQFAGSEANYRIRQIGVFCGDDASAVADSGLMLSIVNVDFTKNENIKLNIIRKDVCTING